MNARKVCPMAPPRKSGKNYLTCPCDKRVFKALERFYALAIQIHHRRMDHAPTGVFKALARLCTPGPTNTTPSKDGSTAQARVLHPSGCVSFLSDKACVTAFLRYQAFFMIGCSCGLCPHRSGIPKRLRSTALVGALAFASPYRPLLPRKRYSGCLAV